MQMIMRERESWTNTDLEFLRSQTLNEVKEMKSDIDYNSRFPSWWREQHNEVLHWFCFYLWINECHFLKKSEEDEEAIEKLGKIKIGEQNWDDFKFLWRILRNPTMKSRQSILLRRWFQIPENIGELLIDFTLKQMNPELRNREIASRLEIGIYLKL